MTISTNNETRLFDFLDRELDSTSRSSECSAYPPYSLERRKCLFLTAVERARWLVLSDYKQMVGEPFAVAIAVATWNREDMKSLDLFYVNTKAAKWPTFILDLDECKTARDFEVKLNAVKPPMQVPVVAVYQKGTLVFAAEGKRAQEVLRSPTFEEIDRR